MVEIATAWVTLAVSADNMQRDINRAFKKAESSAKIAPDVDASKMLAKASGAGQRWRELFASNAKSAPDIDTSKMAAKASTAGRDFGNKFTAGAKMALGAVGAASLGSALIGQFRDVMSVGMDYTRNMNTLQAVTRAGAEEMARAGAAARQLGVDASLPATSVNDAAAAMTELAKGGLTLQQSMAASRGTLQLAAAAGVSAQQAAVIQSDAINTFQLGADQANRVADLLANAANASSGEITDFAMGLSQVGSVAAGFKVPIEDTITSLAMFAKWGIKGSDAGTLMKTSLQALTDQGNPAQAAIKELGLKLYDANGAFVGYPEMLKQVAAAQGTMSDETFQAATNVLFGSDAMRGAMVAARGGADAFSGLKDEVNRVGGAAEVAAAKTKGLPGAWERVKNSLESLQLKAYDKLEGPITKALDALNKAMDGVSAVGANSTFTAIFDAVKAAAPGLGSIATALGKASAAIGVVAWKAFAAALEAAAGVVKVLAPLLEGIGSVMKNNQGVVTAFVGAFAAFKLLPSVLTRVSGAFLPLSSAIAGIGPKLSAMRGGVANAADSWKTMVCYMQQANPQMSTAKANMTLLKNGASGLASGGLGLVKGAASGLVGALGGPLNIALMGATALFADITAKNAAASAAMEGYRAAAKQTSDAQVALNEALLKSNGLMDDAAKAAAGQRVQSAIGELDAASQSNASWLDQFRDSKGSLWGGFTSQIFDFGGANEQNNLAYAKDVQADTARAAKEAIDGLKLSQEQLNDQTTGALPIFEALVASLEKQGSGGYVAAERLKQAREAILGAQKAGETANPVLAKLGDDVVKSAADIKTAFSALPTDVPINVSAPGGQPVYDMLVKLGQKVSTDNDKNIVVEAPLAPEVLTMLEALGYAVRTDNGKLIVVKQEGAEQAKSQIDEAARDRTVTITVAANAVADAVTQAAINAAGRADGAIVPMAAGGLRAIRKPDTAGIYAGRGAGTIFAERETGGEAYIPLAPGKRGRSTRILAEVARLFGYTLNADGSITVDQLKAFASGVSGQTYVRGGGNGDTFATDCSGAQSTIANFITGGRGRFATGTQYQALMARGFQAGDPPPGIPAYWVGWVNGGPGGGHTAGTIVDPAGGNVNVEMGGSSGGGQFGGTAKGAAGFPNRAWLAIAGGENPNTHSTFTGAPSAAVLSAGAAVTSSKAAVTSARARLDQAQAEVDKLAAEGADAKKRDVAAKKRDAAQQSLDAAMEKQTAAETRLSELKDKEAATAEKASAGMDGQSFGQSVFAGLLQGIGLDGSLFSNPFEWPNVKSLMAGLNYGGGLLSRLGAPDGVIAPISGGGGPGMPDINGFLKPIDMVARQPLAVGGESAHSGSGAAPGPSVVVNGNIGMDPRQFTQRIDAHLNNAARRNLSSVKP